MRLEEQAIADSSTAQTSSASARRAGWGVATLAGATAALVADRPAPSPTTILAARLSGTSVAESRFCLQDMARRLGYRCSWSVVAIWRAEEHIFGETEAQLEALGCSDVVSFLELASDVSGSSSCPILRQTGRRHCAAASGPHRGGVRAPATMKRRVRKFLRQSSLAAVGDFSAVASRVPRLRRCQ